MSSTLSMLGSLAGCRTTRRLLKKVQMRGGARRPHARRTPCTLSVRPRAPIVEPLKGRLGRRTVSPPTTTQMGLFQQLAKVDERLACEAGTAHAATTNTTRRSAMSVPLVVDADGHCQEPEEGLAPWMPRELAGRVPRRITDNLGQSRILLEGRVWGKSEGLGPGVSGPFAPHIVGSRPGMRDPKQRLVDMDQEGIDVAVIFGTSIALTVNGLQDRTLAGAICHAVNGWLLEYVSADRRRLKAVGLIPCQDPPAAARELEFLATS